MKVSSSANAHSFFIVFFILTLAFSLISAGILRSNNAIGIAAHATKSARSSGGGNRNGGGSSSGGGGGSTTSKKNEEEDLVFLTQSLCFAICVDLIITPRTYKLKSSNSAAIQR
jgi:hypothetical protein